MAKNTSQESPIDQTIRQIVREELSDIFSSIHSGATAEPTTLSAGSNGSNYPTVIRRRKRKGLSVKGQVTNPATDRRLKVNREANA